SPAPVSALARMAAVVAAANRIAFAVAPVEIVLIQFRRTARQHSKAARAAERVAIETARNPNHLTAAANCPRGAMVVGPEWSAAAHSTPRVNRQPVWSRPGYRRPASPLQMFD